MTTITEAIPSAPRRRAFTVWYKDLTRWSVNTFSESSWAWDPSVLRAFGDVARRRIEAVTRDSEGAHSVALGSIHFDGSMSIRSSSSKQVVKGRLFIAEPGDVVYSKIDARNGAVGVVPPSVGQLGFSAEYPIYEVDPKALDPDFLHLVLRSDHFRRTLNGMASGTSGRKRIQPTDLEQTQIPVPPLAVQRRIVAAAAKARDQAARLRAEADEREAGIGVEVLNRLGLEAPRVPTENQRWFIAKWSDITAWGVRATVRQMRTPDLALGKYPVATGHDCFADIRHGCSLSPSDRDTSLRILKISAVTRGHLRTSEFKHIKDSPRLRKEFEIRAGDLLCCRTNGTLAYVGTPALAESDLDDVIFPDKVIRVRCKDSVLPAYVWLVMKTPHIRGQIEAAARTAVGNYAIGTEDLWAMRLPLPPRGVQAEIVTFAGREQGAVDRLRQKADGVETVASAATERMILGTDLP